MDRQRPRVLDSKARQDAKPHGNPNLAIVLAVGFAVGQHAVDVQVDNRTRRAAVAARAPGRQRALAAHGGPEQGGSLLAPRGLVRRLQGQPQIERGLCSVRGGRRIHSCLRCVWRERSSGLLEGEMHPLLGLRVRFGNQHGVDNLHPVDLNPLRHVRRDVGIHLVRLASAIALNVKPSKEAPFS
eukprot:scaffold2990_cov239-Pinguiococcus_pyrenoidosus.AAC.1